MEFYKIQGAYKVFGRTEKAYWKLTNLGLMVFFMVYTGEILGQVGLEVSFIYQTLIGFI